MWFHGLSTGGLSRRHFVKHMAGFSLMAAPSLQFVQGLKAMQSKLKKEHKSLIILWMGGGPSHMDTWDMKPGEANGGQFKPMKTAADGIQICEHMPNIAKQMKHLSVVRSLVTNEGSHERGRFLMHTAYAQNPAITFPSIGAVSSQQIGPKELAIPGFISVNGPAEGPGFLGMTYAPFNVQNPGSPPQNISLPGDLGGNEDQRTNRGEGRRGFLSTVENSFDAQNRGTSSKAHTDIYKKAFDLTYSQLKSVFDLKKETDGKEMNAKLLEEYGDDGFGRGCLLARKLVEAGVTCVEVSLNGWDNHNNIFQALHTTGQADGKNPAMGRRGGGLVDRLDKGFGALVRDLVDRGLWKNTVVLWMGEFGRTPKINQNGGRDHWARCWSVALGGGGIKGGIVHGSTDKDGTSVKDNPCTVNDVFATVYNAMGIDPNTEIRDPLGRPRKISGDKGGKVIESLV